MVKGGLYPCGFCLRNLNFQILARILYFALNGLNEVDYCLFSWKAFYFSTSFISWKLNRLKRTVERMPVKGLLEQSKLLPVIFYVYLTPNFKQIVECKYN